MVEALGKDLISGAETGRRIVVLDTAASKTGALSILRDYHAYVRDLKDNNEWFFIIGLEGLIKEDKAHPNIHVIVREDVKRSRFKRLLFDHFTGEGFLRKLRPDVVISLQNTLPRGAERLGKTVIYLHQPLGFQKIKRFSFFNKWERGLAVYQYLIASEIDRSLKKADRIIVQTEWMRDAVIEKDGIAADRIVVEAPVVDLCKPSVGSPGKEPGTDTADALCKPDADLCKPESGLFIFPAGNILYKNHQCIIDALKILCDRGKKDLKVIFTEKEENLPWLNIPTECRPMLDWRGNIPRDELMGLYRRAVLIFPSYIETYGLPLKEAREMGGSIIAADTPFAREILSGYGRASFFDPFDPEALSELMSFDPAALTELMN